MRYLITISGIAPFFTAFFDTENHFSDGMTVYDIYAKSYTTDGANWKPINEDHL